MKNKLKLKKVRALVSLNLSTRQHKQAKGTGSFSRKNKFKKSIDLAE